MLANLPDAETVAPDFDGFFSTFAREVAAVVALTTGDVGAAEDATQEAMARAYTRWERVRRLDRPDLWVIRVATRIAIDTWRKRRREVTLGGSSLPVGTIDEVRILWLRWGLAHLSPEDRLLVILRHRDGLSIDELAGFLSKSPHTIRTYLRRARRRLRSALLEGDH